MPNPHLPNVLNNIFNRPLAIAEDKAVIILSALADRVGIEQLLVTGPDGEEVALTPREMQAIVDQDAMEREGREQDRPLYAVRDGIAIIPVQGTLMKTWGVHPSSGATGYDGITFKARKALDDQSVDGVLLDIDSNGGVVSGFLPAAQELFAYSARNGGKPIWALADDNALSAGYGIAAMADHVVMTSSGATGSVGVIVVHMDYSKSLEQRGITATIISAGSHKEDRHRYKALSEDDYQDIKAMVEHTRGEFANIVSAGRGLSLEAVMDTEAQIYTAYERPKAKDALAVGFIDEILHPQEVLPAFREHLNKA